ncbi:DUF5689 domain-containing protein [Porphyromonas sp.]|uniref:DUF5689 domain-containing protein n=1 Tax=Porphyromonas sp. TaxID=1924944 RepID=UPI0026DC99F5|nr:DUF5689 domain-containing protein [Porphyromonas sp.]MDO4695762.1 DUF5689 domain-containing protein [Porphyromonas sp.]MDO4770469.1 DUF5689 domain-containing protein [Porphyromonas sp.]
MKQKVNILLKGHVLLLVLLGGFLSACNFYDKHDPVAPLNEELPKATITIAEVKAMYKEGGNFITGDKPLIIRGQVISSDRYGNLYNELYVQDETGGIKLSLSSSALHGSYPLGSEVAMTINGLKLGKAANNLSIGVDSNRVTKRGDKYENDRIPLPIVHNVLKCDGVSKALVAKTVTIKEIDESLNGSLVKIKDVQFVSPDETWATPTKDNKSGESRDLQDKSGNTIIVRNSDYSTFAGTKLPNGSGEIVAIVTYFLKTKQLVVSSPEDAKFTNPRFEVGGGDGPAPKVTSTVSAIKALYTNAPVELPAKTVFEATVISSDKDGNFYRDLYLQDSEEQGISIKINRKNIFQTYPIGTKLIIDVSGLTLGRDNNRLSIGTKGSGNYQTAFVDWDAFIKIAFKNGTESVQAKVVTIPEITQSMWCTFIEIKGLTAVNGGKKKWVEEGKDTNSTFKDEAGNEIIIRCNKFVPYKDKLLPTGKVNIKGVLSGFNTTNQIFLNTIEDVEEQ